MSGSEEAAVLFERFFEEIIISSFVANFLCLLLLFQGVYTVVFSGRRASADEMIYTKSC